MRYDYRVAHKDTRLLAKEWVEQKIPAGTKILLDDSGPKLQMSREKLQEFYETAKAEAGVGPFTTHLKKYYEYRMLAVKGQSYDITEISHPWWLKKEKGMNGKMEVETLINVRYSDLVLPSDAEIKEAEREIAIGCLYPYALSV